ncbi:tetratricopeptide repeat protein [Dechloromonas sp. ZY10]|uniref:tetratricopeptide repeat protein n=1 Tax=Dechloromonas aquae TaxID=2664436 RepID=UPI003527AA8A
MKKRGFSAKRYGGEKNPSQPVTLEQLLHKGLEAIERQRWQEASSIYKFLACERPNHPDVLHGLARIAWGEGRTTEGLALLRRALYVSPAFWPFCVLLGDWHLAVGDVEEGYSNWRKALIIGAPPPLVVERLESSYPLVKLDQKLFAQALVARANGLVCLKEGRDAEAVVHYLAAFDCPVFAATALEYKEAGTAALNAKSFDLAEKWLFLAQRDLPGDPDIVLNLGNVAQFYRDHFKAEAYYRRVLELKPSMPEAYNNLGVVLKNTSRLLEGEECLRQAIKLRDSYSAAWNNLGLVLQLQNRLEEAEIALRRGLQLAPTDVDLAMNLGAVLGQQGRRAEAEPFYQKAAELAPDNAIVLCNLGVNAFEKKDYVFAKQCYEKAIAADPKWMPARNNLSALYMDVGRHEQAIEICKEILAIEPDYADAYNNMGISYRQINRLGEAKSALERCLDIKSDHKEALSNLAFVNQDLGDFEKALDLYRRALEVDNKKKTSWDNYLFCSNYHPSLSQDEHLAIYSHYDSVMGLVDKPINALPCPINDRKLRVGYVSGDLRKHPQQHFFMPFLDHHDRNRFEVWCYHNGVIEDDVSREMIAKSDGWRRTSAMNSEEMARQIADDKIDILVDLAGHTGGNRTDVYPYRAAPVQLASLLGWNFGVGLSCMDALIGDYWTLPESLEQYTIEPLLRLPCNTYVCRMDPNLPRLHSLPARRRGYLTFGTTTRSVRLNDRDLGLWAELLKSVPNSHLQFNSRNFKDPASINRMIDFFGLRGVSADRLEFDFTSPIYKAFESIDIYLDTFPHNNGTTLFEALWYGLPVITKMDRPPFGCIGASILHHGGMPDLIAKTEEEYISIAQRLAGDLDALERRRIFQRDTIASTALFDEVTSVRWFERAYFAMYQKKLEGLKQ